MANTRVGIIGAGTIGRSIFDHLQSLTSVDIDYVLVSKGRDRNDTDPIASTITTDIEWALSRDVDLVIEAATPEVLATLGPGILSRSDLCGFSCSALSDRSTEDAINDAALKGGRRFYLPHGAIIGLDGLMDGRDQIQEVTITTTKSGPSLGMADDTEGVLYDGFARDVCARFPRNVNVHAAVALAGIGFDRTRSIVIAQPGTKAMKHHIAVSGHGLSWDITVTSVSLGGVTGSFTPRSAVGSVRRILGLSAFINV